MWLCFVRLRSVGVGKSVGQKVTWNEVVVVVSDCVRLDFAQIWTRPLPGASVHSLSNVVADDNPKESPKKRASGAVQSPMVGELINKEID